MDSLPVLVPILYLSRNSVESRVAPAVGTNLFPTATCDMPHKSEPRAAAPPGMPHARKLSLVHWITLATCATAAAAAAPAAAPAPASLFLSFFWGSDNRSQ